MSRLLRTTTLFIPVWLLDVMKLTMSLEFCPTHYSVALIPMARGRSDLEALWNGTRCPEHSLIRPENDRFGSTSTHRSSFRAMLPGTRLIRPRGFSKAGRLDEDRNRKCGRHPPPLPSAP